MDIGKDVHHKTVVPLKHPIRAPEPVQQPVPQRAPITPERVKEPA